MNPIVSTFAVTASLFLCSNPLRGQPADEPLPVAPARPETGEEQLKAEKHLLLTEIQDQQAEFEKSAADFEKHRADMEKRLAEQGAKAAAAAATAQKKYTERVQNVVRRNPGTSSRSLVIRTSEGDPKDLANLEEDLTIMSHIYNKALKENLGASFDRKAVMGIDVFFTPGASPIRSLYLEGYGALFLFGVSWPLLPPPAPAEATKDKPDSTWDEAKHELYGPRIEGKATPGEEFSSEKLTKLQNILLETTKNAANIRNLKPDDSITLCVFGGPARGTSLKMKGKSKDKEEGETDAAADEDRPKKAWALDSAVSRGTTMTIQIKKSDTDAYATGKLSLEQFREKARIATYVGTPITGNVAFSFVNGALGGQGFGGGGFGGGELR